MHFVDIRLLVYGITSLLVLLLTISFVDWFRARQAYSVLSDGRWRAFRRLAVRYVLVSLVGAMIISALSQPYILGSRAVPMQKESYAVMLFDLSRSMGVSGSAEEKTRLERAKNISINSLLSLFTNGEIAVYGYTRQLGPFLNFTDERGDVIRAVRDLVDIEAVTGTGSDIVNAINRTAQQFPDDSDKEKFIILFSDGDESLNAYKSGRLGQLLSFVKDKGIKVIVVGVGEREQVFVGEKNGRVETSALNEDTLRRVADASGGIYVYESEISEIENPIQGFLAGILRGDQRVMQETKDISGYFVASAVALLWMLWYLDGHKRRKKITPHHN